MPTVDPGDTTIQFNGQPGMHASGAAGPREGSRLGRYRIGRRLGGGGMGEVYAAEEVASHRQVAIKVVNPSIASAVSRDRFLREGQLAARINHPNSVYVFGTEEIDRTLVISMELMPGGTLADVVEQRGALPCAESVDAVLEIISGLRAAEAQGVLHRDIKPANCFVDEYGTVKVGDYGLSRPTGDAERTDLTKTGAIMGTPSFAPPEQLKGEPVDVRTDIYAVGATLLYLLTGELPFRGDNAVQVISAVLSQPPHSLPKLTGLAPPGLRKLVLRCLEKDATRRPQTYDELERGLRPFGSESPQSAPVGLRMLAGAVDLFCAVMISTVATILLVRFATFVPWNDPLELVVLVVCFVLYFAVSESLVRATPGKLVFGLRVLPRSGIRLGAAASFARAVLFGVPFVAHLALSQIVRPGPPASGELILNLLIYLFGPLLLFIGARRDTGWRGLHDRWTRSCVATPPRTPPMGQKARIPPSKTVPTAADSPAPAYRTVGRLGACEEAPVVVARDDVLERDVWLHGREPGSGTTSARRALSRPTRLRWLAGVDGDGWDAYEAVDGRPMTSLGEPQAWERVRAWILSAASELIAGEADGSAMELVAPEQLWITRDGRLKLVEASLLGLQTMQTADGWEVAQRALARAAGRALVPGWSTHTGVPAAALPLAARELLKRLAGGEYRSPRDVYAEPALHRDPGWSLRKRRMFSLAIQGGPAAVAVVFISAVMMLAFVTPRFFEGQVVLKKSLKHLVALESPTCKREGDWESERRAARILVSSGIRETAEFAARLTGQFDQSDMSATREGQLRALSTRERELAREALAAHPSPSQDDVQWARERMAAVLDLERGSPVERMRRWPLRAWIAIVVLFAWIPLAVIGAVELLATLVLGQGVIFRLLGLAVVRGDGTPPSRGRSLLRAAVVWLLPLLGIAALLVLARTDSTTFFAATVVIMLIGVFWAVVNPSRGLPDRIVGTCVVLR